MQKIFSRILFLALTFFLPLVATVFAGNIQNSNSSAILDIDLTPVDFVCNGCDVEVSDNEIEGIIWGPSLGWVNLQPFDGGVFNNVYGEVSGSGWGSVAGFVDFSGVSIDPNNGQFSGTAFSQNRGPIIFECPGNSCVITTWRPQGCTDPNATNFVAYATQDDGSCVFPVLGCMSPTATNFNPLAQEDNGTCQFPTDPGDIGGTLFGCTNPQALNFSPVAASDDGSCLYICEGGDCTQIVGCTDPLALNFNPNANTLGSCFYDIPGNGCTNPLAINFNPNATTDNGTCLFGIGDTENPDNTSETGLFPVDISGNGGDGFFSVGLLGDSTMVGDILNGNNNNLPDWLNGILSAIQNAIKNNSNLGALIGLLVLAASLLQTMPFREGNLLFSYFSFYTTKKYWGTVYDSVTKQPLDPAYVTLFDEAGQAIDTSITDIDGRYNFVVSSGTYFLSAQKTDYQFPSTRLLGKTYDELYTHLYFGGAVVIEKEDDIISRNIPMDPLRFNWNEYEKKKTKVTHFYRPWHRTLSILARVVFWLGFVFALWVFLVSPSVFALVVLLLYIVSLVLKALGFRKLPRGSVQDVNGYAFPFGIIRVYSEKLQREVKHTIIGEAGHYLLLVPNGRYYMTIEQKTKDGSYSKVHTTKAFTVRSGFIAKKIKIPQAIVVDEVLEFEKEFGGTKKS